MDENSTLDETSRVREPHSQASLGRKKRGGSENLDDERSFLKKSQGYAEVGVHVGDV
jgi:hypothetical protein